MKTFIWLSVIIFGLGAGRAQAEEIVFKNGDKISGAILEDTASYLVVNSQALGTITIDRVFIESPAHDGGQGQQTAMDDGEKKAEWSRSVTLGYSRSGGNTVESEASGALAVTRKTDDDEWNFRASALYGSGDRKMDEQKYYGMLRYGWSFGQDKEWYDFVKLEADHDRFANIDYRFVPTAGIGYWFADEDQWKLKAEVGTGWEYTSYRDGTTSGSDVVLVPRGYVKKLLIGDLWLEEDLTAYLVVDDYDRYRLRSETSLIQKISEQLSWKLSFVDDYNANPGGNAKKNDYRLISSVEYAF